MSDTNRKILIIVVLLLVILFGVGQFFAFSNISAPNQPSSQNGGTPTRVMVYEPPLPANSTPVEKGSCFASSIAAPYRADAWRCMVGNAISDPCFELATGGGKSLLCGANPAAVSTSSMFVLQLTKSLPQASVPAPASTTSGTTQPSAWLVQLVDGTICTPFTGTRPFDASGDVATYACNGGPNESMIFGDLNNASPVWTAEIGSLSTATSTFPPPMVASATVPIYAVWQ